MTSDTQLLYLVVYCIWLISYKKNLHHMLHQTAVVAKLTEILKAVSREKVVRLCLATFMNVYNATTTEEKESAAPSSETTTTTSTSTSTSAKAPKVLTEHVVRFNDEMVGAGLPKVLISLEARKWKDEDLVKDLKNLSIKLQDKILELSSFEMYEAEVLANKLRWTPVHSEQFWRENHQKFEENNFELIKKLIGVLMNMVDNDDDVQLSVACYDLGEFARFHPDGKRVVQRQHGKACLMQCMNHKSAEVQKHALLAVQKLMVNNWESLQSGGMGL